MKRDPRAFASGSLCCLGSVEYRLLFDRTFESTDNFVLEAISTTEFRLVCFVSRSVRGAHIEGDREEFVHQLSLCHVFESDHGLWPPFYKTTHKIKVVKLSTFGKCGRIFGL